MKTRNRPRTFIIIFLIISLLWVIISDAKLDLGFGPASKDKLVEKTGVFGVGDYGEVPPKPEGIDLDVTYISRTPMYNRYQVEYTKAGEPYLVEGTERDQRWPKQGELVTFTAHIMNKGTLASGLFTYQWLIDDQIMLSAEHASLPPGIETTVSFDWEWSHPSEGERLLESHTIGFSVDPDNTIIETFEKNNQLKDHTDASSLAILLTPEVYEALEKPISSIWTYSAEDWLQRQIKAMNTALEASVYDDAPGGVLERVRLDQIIITESNMPTDFLVDGQFFIDQDLRFERAYYDSNSDVSGWLIHDLSHLLGVIDIYKLDVPLETVQVRDSNAQPVQMEFYASTLYGGIMSDPGITPKQYDEHTTLALNLNKGYRHGYFGEYLYDLHEQTSLQLLDSEGNPAKDVQVRLYQRFFTPKINGSTAGTIDNQPEIEGITDSDGLLVLTNRPVSAPVSTATGHSLRDNPLSVINVTGSNGMFLVELLKGSHQEFHWLDITDLNLAAWKGNPTIQLQTHFPTENAPVVPIRLTGIQQKGAVELQWTAGESEERVRFNVYRADSPNYEFYQILTKVGNKPYVVKLGNQSRSVIFAVKAVNLDEVESGFSNFVFTFPLAGPAAVEVDANNYRIVLDPKNGYALLAQSADGAYEQVLSSTQNHLDRSKFMALGTDGVLFVTHPGDAYSERHSVQLFDQTQTLLMEFGTTGSAEGQFLQPAGIAVWGEPCVDESCRILVADSGNNRIQVFDRNGVFISSYGKKGIWHGQFKNPQGIAVNSLGQVVVVDSGNNRLQILSFDGTRFSHVKTIRRGFKAPTDVAVYGSEYIVVSDTGHNKVKLLTGEGKLINEFTVGREEYFGKFSSPTGVAIDLMGNIIVADTGNQRVVTLTGVIPIPN